MIMDLNLTDTYRKHASWQSMEARLVDLYALRTRVDRVIRELEDMSAARKEEVRLGTWPTPTGTDEVER